MNDWLPAAAMESDSWSAQQFEKHVKDHQKKFNNTFSRKPRPLNRTGFFGFISDIMMLWFSCF